MNCICKFPQPMTIKHVPGQGAPAAHALNGSVAAHALVFRQQAGLRRITMVMVILGEAGGHDDHEDYSVHIVHDDHDDHKDYG